MRTGGLIGGLALLALTGFGCGGGGSSGGGGSGSMGGIDWPSRDGGMPGQLPPSVNIGRIIFSSASGEACCVAVDPKILSGDAGRGLAVLTDLAIGPATVTVAGFSTDFAPTVPGILTTCTTVPADIAQPCDPLLVASPAFESPPLSVVILGGVQTNLPEVPIEAFPFLLNFSPAQDASVTPPVQFDFTVVDGVTNINPSSVAVDVTFNVPTNEPPLFRPITKRVLIALDPCDDDTDTPCSSSGNLSLAGFKAAGTAPELPVGPVEARIVAENVANPPRNLDLRYSFNVLPSQTATATVTATPTAATGGSGQATGAAADDPTAAEAAGQPQAAHDNANHPASAATPTATPSPGGAE